MTPRTWAERKVKQPVKFSKFQCGVSSFVQLARRVKPVELRRELMLLLALVVSEGKKSEHQRAVRICKKYQKAARESQSMMPSAKAGYELACKQFLAALERGRGKGGNDGLQLGVWGARNHLDYCWCRTRGDCWVCVFTRRIVTAF